jgi:ornithine carbamoyltransferase
MSKGIPDSLRRLEHFLSIRDLEPETLQALIDFSIQRKAAFKSGKLKPMLQGKVLAMIFQKSSLRTRIAFEAAMAQLGGHAVNLEDHQVGIGQREDVRDVARVICSMCNGITARVMRHQLVIELAAHSSVPVINALSDWSHPCQAVADFMTIKEHFAGDLRERKLAYIGDGNNVARSLLNACAKLGMAFSIAAPSGYELDDGFLESARTWEGSKGGPIVTTQDPAEAATDADVLYTDVWTSMGQEAEQAERLKAFAGYQINADLMRHARPTAVVMHCLPAHRGEEITEEVMEGPQSVVFQQAENRLHSQRALLEILLG